MVVKRLTMKTAVDIGMSSTIKINYPIQVVKSPGNPTNDRPGPLLKQIFLIVLNYSLGPSETVLLYNHMICTEDSLAIVQISE